MHKTKTTDGRANLCGGQVAALRKAISPRCSQRMLAAKLQLLGMDVDKNAVQRIECGKRTVSDIELRILAQALDVSVDRLLANE